MHLALTQLSPVQHPPSDAEAARGVLKEEQLKVKTMIARFQRPCFFQCYSEKTQQSPTTIQEWNKMPIMHFVKGEN